MFNIISVRLCSCLSYVAGKLHLSTPYFIVFCSVAKSAMFSHCLINGTIFEKKKIVWEHKTRVLIFSTSFVWNNTILRSTQRGTLYYCCQILTTLEFSEQIFEKKIVRYEISWKSVQWEPSCSMRIDRRAGTERERERETHTHTHAHRHAHTHTWRN